MEVFGSNGKAAVILVSFFSVSCSVTESPRLGSRIVVKEDDPETLRQDTAGPAPILPTSEPTYLNFGSHQLRLNCLNCHSGVNRQKISLENYGDRGSPKTLLFWGNVVAQIDNNRMPASKPLSDEIKVLFNRWKALGFPYDDIDLKSVQKNTGVDYCSVEELLPARFWRLSDRQIAATIRNAFGDSKLVGVVFPIVSRTGGHFLNTNGALSMGQSDILNQLQLAQAVSASVVAQDTTIKTCTSGSGLDCFKQVIQTYGPKLWRRPLSAEESQALVSNAENAIINRLSREEGMRLLIESLLNSTNFWYRSELGVKLSNGQRQLTGYELASFLSYTIWDAPPDSVLTGLAENGTLLNDVVLKAQVLRMSSAASAKAGLFRFFDEWLNLTSVVGIEKSDNTLTQTLRNSLVAETQAYVDEFGFNKNQPLAEFFTNSRTLGNSQVATFYNATFTGSTTNSIVPIELEPLERAGLLTHASFIASNSGYTNTNIVRRGYTLLSEILCSELSPPPNVIDGAAKVAEDPTKPMTSRQRLENLHTANPACASCHTILDPLGSSLENYDPIGRYRTLERTLKIDASGSLSSFSDANGKFNNGVEMIKLVTSSKYFADCASNKYFQFAFGVKVDDPQRCDAKRAASSFEKSGQRIRQLPEMLNDTRSLKFRK